MAPYKIVVFSGDHSNIPPASQVTAEALKVLQVISKVRPQIQFDFQEHLLGGASIDATGSPLTEEALEAAKAADAVILGAIGGPKWGTGPIRPEQGLLRLRKEMLTFGNLRPCSFASPSLIPRSPLKESICTGVDFIIIRELTGGIYFGARKEDDDGSGEAWDTEPYSRPEIERVTRLAGFLARRGDPTTGLKLKVTSLDKANVLATSRLWRKVVTEIMTKEFSDLELEHQLIDSAAMIMIKDPRKLNGVVVTSNLFGDIISDEASVIPGSLGLLPSASLGGIPDGTTKVNGIYEPIHGSAPDLPPNSVNPIAAILSVAMLLRYSLNLDGVAKAIEEGVRRALDRGVATRDIGGEMGTVEVGDEVAREVEGVLGR
ncbi:MAG: 3-isopropylmalate dehydrogenase [Caeruleum heppii]|nr:MAG: 3-isopropylmalate dehydrogenase [Caeruleum heppii]